MRLERFVERLVISASYSALRWITKTVSPLAMNGLVPISILGVVWTRDIGGLQTLCGMVAGQGLSLAVPMPSEPAGYLIVPVVVLYFGVISAAGWCVDGTLQLLEKRTPELADALSSVFERYISLFATTRALAVFQVLCAPPPPLS